VQETFFIRNGDIAFALAGAFVFGVAAVTFGWNVLALLSLLVFVSSVVICYFSVKKLLPTLAAILLVFIFAVGYCHFFTPTKDQTTSTPPQKKSNALNFPSAIFSATLPSEQSELLSAIMSGSTSAVDSDLKSQMSISGTSYVVNMYGYKINLFAAALLGVGKRFFSRRIAFIIAAFVVIVFILMAGAPLTAIRAGIMMGLVFLAKISGRQFHTRNVFTFTMAVMLLFDPTLLGNVGFQLSFLSLLGLFVLGPPFKRLFRYTGHELLEWKAHAIMALSVNAAIMPLVMMQFGDFSITSFISNFLITIPLAAVIALALTIAALGCLSLQLAYFAGSIANIFLSYQLWVIKIFSVVVVPIPSIFQSGFFIAAYYFLLAAFALYYEKNQDETMAPI
jgi:competence protein ComEC